MSAGLSPLAKAREAAGYSQESFADAVGVARNTVSRWERGVTRPQADVRRKVAAALKITLGELDALLGSTPQPSGALLPRTSQPVDHNAARQHRDDESWQVAADDKQPRSLPNQQLLLGQLGVPPHLCQRSASSDSSNRITVDSAPAPAQATDGTEEGTTDVNRRGFLSSTGTLIMLGLMPPPERLGITQVGHDAADDILNTAFELRKLDHKGGGAALYPIAAEYLSSARSQIAGGAFTSPGVESAVRSATGVLALTVAWLANDADDQVSARTLYLEASDVGQREGNRHLAVDALNHLSHQATILHNPRDAIAYAREATAISADWASPGLTALLALREARGHAADPTARDTEAVNACLARAMNAFEKHQQAPPDPYPWMGALDTSELTGQRGTCYADLGDVAAAETAFAAVYNQRHDAAHPRSRSHYWLRYGQALATQNKIDHACDVAATTVPTIAHIKSERVHRRLRNLHTQLATGPGANSRSVIHLKDVLDTHGLLARTRLS
jgi:transcriptional regulator with XRE-family HTH domain/tetratricopeptide (TPR) repeat protein